MAITENEGITYVNKYYGLITQYATAESPSLATKIAAMHIGEGYVYPDVEVNLGTVSETKGVRIRSVYLASITSRQDMLLKFVPKDIALESNRNGICTMVYTMYVYSGNEQVGRDVLKYSVPLKMEIQNNKIRSIYKGNRTTPQYTLSVTPTSLSFEATGGTRTITVTSNTTWTISENPASWGHLTRSGNTLTLRVDANTSAQSRTDYFTIKAGTKEQRVNISQVSSSTTTPAAQIKSIAISHNRTLDDGKGMIIYVSFNVQNMKGKKGRAVAYFYDNDGNRIKDSNGKYNTSGSNVCTFKDITPRYDNSRYDSLELKIPYSELHQMGTYTRTLKFSISIWDKSVTPSNEITSSSFTTFSFTPTTEPYLTLDGSSSNKTKYFSESGGRETYSVKTSAISYETWGVPSWCRIENKSSSSFTLVCEPNTTSTPRSDYMKVKADGKEIRIDIKQDGQSKGAIVHNCYITHNLSQQVWNGYMYTPIYYMQIHCHFEVNGYKGKNIRVCAYFYYQNGNKAPAQNYEYRTTDGQATVQGTGKCDYEGTLWKDYTLNIPYYALPIGNLKMKIQIQDSNGNFLAESSEVSFTRY